MNQEVKALRSDLALLKLQFSERIGAVEHRLNELLTQEQTPSENTDPSAVVAEELSISVEQKTPNNVQIQQTTNASHHMRLAANDKPKVETPVLPSFITLFLKALLSSIFDWFAPATKIYESYKERGMLGIFILTMVGIGLTLAGFGYLMQLLIDQLGAGSKSVLMCGVAISVMGLGIALKIKTRFGEFATAIVTLGILLSYSTVYFSGSIYGLLPNVIILILYLCIALLSHALALWLDTKVVAALGVIGIATMPMLSNTIGIEPLYYLLSLTFVVGSSLYLAYKHIGPWLAQLSLAFTVLSLEWIIGFETVVISAWVINLFYLLFFVYVISSLLKDGVTTTTGTNQTPSSNKQSFTFLAALMGSIVLIFFQATDVFTTQISVNFALNTLISVVVSLLFYKVKRDLVPLLVLLSATWGVLTIISIVTDAFWGIAWAIEGILLLIIGRKYSISATVNQGQVLTAIALIYSLSALAIYFPLPALASFNGWLLSIIIIAVIAVWQRIINNTDVFNQITQHKVKPFLQWLEVVWLSVLCIATADIWLGNWTGVTAILVQIALLFRAKYCKQVSIEIFAALLIFVPLFYVTKGVFLADSYRFTLLPLFAQLALISMFIQLWLWSAFYRKYQPDSRIKHVAESLRILFYLLIPIFWVASVIRRFDLDALMFLWLSPLLALLLAHKVKHHLLIKEAKILAVLTCFAFATTVGQLSLINSIITLVGFSSFYGIAYWLNRKETIQIHTFVFGVGVLSLGFAIPNIVGFQTNNLVYGAITAAVYWGVIFNLISCSEHLKRNKVFVTVINLGLVVSAWPLIYIDVYFVIVPAIFLLATLYKKEQRFINSPIGSFFKLNSDLFLHSLVAMSYAVLFSSLTSYRLDLLIAPALAIHGALVLFLKDRRITTVKYSFVLMLLGIIKLAMVDAANALLWQKVVLFMGIGVFILIASFWYQKLVNKTELSKSENV